MRAKKWNGWAIGISAIAAAFVGTEAIAIPPNLSDITGTNIFDNPVIIIPPGLDIDPELVSTARRLSDEIEDAYLACACSKNSLPSGPRRFARGPGDPNTVCPNPECDRLYKLLEEADVFLKRVETLHVQYRRAYTNRIW